MKQITAFGLAGVLLLLTPVSFAAMIFSSDWGKSHGKAPGMWHDLHAVSPDRFRLEKDPAISRGAPVVRVEVRAGDKVNHWSGERSEVVGMETARGSGGVSLVSGHEFYALAIRLDSNWKAPDRNAGGYRWGTFFQLHGPDDLHASPSIAMMVDETFHLDLCAGDITDGGTRKKSRGAVSEAFTDGSLNAGHWTAFLLDVVWATDEKGSIAVYRRNEGKKEWEKVLDKPQTPTLQYEWKQPVGEHYWKAGFYSSETAHTNLLWLGPIVRGRTRNEVEAAFAGR